MQAFVKLGCYIAPLLLFSPAPAAAAEPASAEVSAPIAVDALYIADVLHNSRGGLRTGTDYIDKLRLEAAFDAERLFGIKGSTFFVSAEAINYTGFGGTYVGEFQALSNVDAETGVRLYEAWFDQYLVAERLSLRAGLYDLNSEFDAIEPAGLFLNSSHGIGPELAQTGLNGPSIFPVTSLGARLAWQDPSGITARFVVLDGVPGDPAHPRRTTIKLSNADGALLAGEVEYDWSRGRAAVGAWTYTSRFDDLVQPDPLALERSHNHGAYAFASGRIFGQDDASPTVDGYVRAGIAPGSINVASAYIGAGLVGTGLIPGRAEDQAGLSVAVARTGGPSRRPNPSGGPAATVLAALDSHETIIEATYRAQLTDWLALQPDAQWVMNPGFSLALRDAFVVGLRFEVSPLALWK